MISVDQRTASKHWTEDFAIGCRQSETDARNVTALLAVAIAICISVMLLSIHLQKNCNDRVTVKQQSTKRRTWTPRNEGQGMTICRVLLQWHPSRALELPSPTRRKLITPNRQLSASTENHSTQFVLINGNCTTSHTVSKMSKRDIHNTYCRHSAFHPFWVNKWVVTWNRMCATVWVARTGAIWWKLWR